MPPMSPNNPLIPTRKAGTFWLIIKERSPFIIGDIIVTGLDAKLYKIVKFYKPTRWRLLLRHIGFANIHVTGAKVIEVIPSRKKVSKT